jgi:hypothetical protein
MFLFKKIKIRRSLFSEKLDVITQRCDIRRYHFQE